MLARTGTHERLVTLLLVAIAIHMIPPVSFAGVDPSKQRLRRKGVVMGLDPGLSLRFNEFGTPLYARLTVRLSGCYSSKVQFGGDWRSEILVAGERGTWTDRHAIGPVATFFVHKGWFVRPHLHAGLHSPFVLTPGASTGYEWEMGRFSGAGISLGGDMDIRFDGRAPDWALVISFYLAAYDLGTRKGRNPL